MITMANWRNIKGEDLDIVISTRIRLARNVEGYEFTGNITEDRAHDLDSELSQAIEQGLEGVYSHIRVKDLEDPKLLMENQLISRELIQNKEISSFCLSKDQGVNFMINEEDHLRLQVLTSGMNLDENLKKSMNLISELEKQVNFSFHMDFGYLTACPTNTGTGLRASCMMHLPALTAGGLLPGIVDSLGKLGVTVRGQYGENSQPSGGIYQISNQKTLGMTEDEVVKKLKTLVSGITDRERDLRDQYYNNFQLEYQDWVYRSIGLLKYAKQLGEWETTQALSMLRLGVAQGIYKGISLDEVTELMFNVKKHNVLKYMRDIDMKATENVGRSQYVKSYFEEVEING